MTGSRIFFCFVEAKSTHRQISCVEKRVARHPGRSTGLRCPPLFPFQTARFQSYTHAILNHSTVKTAVAHISPTRAAPLRRGLLHPPPTSISWKLPSVVRQVVVQSATNSFVGSSFVVRRWLENSERFRLRF